MLALPYLVWTLFTAAAFFASSMLQARSRNGLPMAIVGAVIGAIFGYWVVFAFQPVFHVAMVGTWMAVIITLFLAHYWGVFTGIFFGDDGGESFFGLDYPDFIPSSVVLPILSFLAMYGLLLLAVVGSSWGVFHDKAYASLVQPKLESRDVKLPLVDQSQARLVTAPLAVKRGAELISTSDESALGSRVHIGEPWGNEVNGKLVWVSALEHNDFSRWSSFHTTPGYVMVSQSNEVDASLVANHPMLYNESGFWGENIYKRAYENGYSGYLMERAVLQVDDGGRPFWLMVMTLPRVGFGGHMPDRWVLMDAGTGDMVEYATEAELPEWVDRAYPQHLIAERFDEWACFSQGWWACLWTGEDVIQSTPGIGVTMDPAGEIIYYSGTQFQSSVSQGATSGMLLANARTGQITYYRRAGITETVAQQVITNGWSNFGYVSAEPIPLTMGDQEAYFAIVLDGAGARKGFGVVSMTNRNVFGVGDSIQSAVSAYNLSMRRSNQDAALDAGQLEASEVFYGIVKTIVPFVSNGKTVFYVSLDGNADKIFEVGEERVGEVVATLPGDPVRIDAVDASTPMVYSVAFDNLRLAFAGMGPGSLTEPEAALTYERFLLDGEPPVPILQTAPTVKAVPGL